MFKHQPRDPLVVAEGDRPADDFPRNRARDEDQADPRHGSDRGPKPASKPGPTRRDPAFPEQPHPPRRAPGKHPYSRRVAGRSPAR